MLKYVCWCAFLVRFCYADLIDLNFSELVPNSDDQTQKREVLNLISRIIPERSGEFLVEIDFSLGLKNRDAFHIEKLKNGSVLIIGKSGVAAATGFHHYLKYYCLCHISWQTENLQLPQILPDVNITVNLVDRFRYYQNVCTVSYSFVWWNWTHWEKHIDWIALNSFNLVLSFHGQEAIWKRAYKKFNLTDEEIDEFLTGPAFLSWGRMGNIQSWGGTLSESWHSRSVRLQKRILSRMRNFGITPVLPAFAGHVPRAFKRVFPDAKLSKTPTWNDFDDPYCCPYVLEPTDPLFDKIGSTFISELTTEFGTNHAYSCDTFNENLPTTHDPAYLSQMGRSIYASIASVDSQAIWVMQNWLFVHDFIFWTKDRAKALLTSVPLGKMIVLDLQSEQHPLYKYLDSYFGQPYIWCMLHNFGGTLGMFGSLDIINRDIFAARQLPNTTLIGTGLTPEGINQNYVVYDLMTEMAWRTEPTNLTEWLLAYSIRRYGKREENAFKAWKIFASTVYNFTGLTKMRGKYTINRRPTLQIRPWSWYDTCDFMDAWDSILQVSDNLQKNSKTYLYDLVDTTRQVLQILGDQYYTEIQNAVKDKQLDVFSSSSKLLLEVFDDMEEILKSNEAFLLGRWLESAKLAANNDNDTKLFEYNARNQITLWGPKGEIVDYANKQWSGIISDFFRPRWALFLDALNASLVSGEAFNGSAISIRIFEEVEKPFTLATKSYPTEASGDSVKIAQKIHNKWWGRIRCRTRRSFVMPEDILVSLV